MANTSVFSKTPGMALIALLACGSLPSQSRAAARPVAMVPDVSTALGASPVADPIGEILGLLGNVLNVVTGNVDKIKPPSLESAAGNHSFGNHNHRSGLKRPVISPNHSKYASR